MKQEMQQEHSNSRRIIFRPSVDVELLKEFKVTCIRLEIKEFIGIDEALREWIEKRQKM